MVDGVAQCITDKIASVVTTRTVGCGSGVFLAEELIRDYIVSVVLAGGVMVVYFFFQAEDGIRDYKVTGVQTCALPISPRLRARARRAEAAQAQHPRLHHAWLRHHQPHAQPGMAGDARGRGQRRGNRYRSEERRVGKECRSRWSPYH